MTVQTLLRCCIVAFCFGGLSVGLVNAAEPADTNYDEQKTPRYTLPPLLPDATSAQSSIQYWKQTRRSEVLSLLEEHVYGKTPSTQLKINSKLIEKSDDAMGGLATRRQIRITVSSPQLNPSRSVDIDVLIYTPNHSNGPAPAFIGLNFYGNQTVHTDPDIHLSQRWMRGNGKIGIIKNRATEKTRGVYQDRWQAEMLIKRGYGLITAYCGDLDPDNYQHDFSDGIHPLFYKPGQSQPEANQWGAIGAWAWGLSTIRTLLDSDTLIDANRIAVIGHSRLGKAALWAGAQDPKFAIVISNNSGCGGAALYRRCYGERIHHMIKPVGYWFCRNHAKYAQLESTLPVDQHMLLALVAPRPLYIASATEDQWADPKGEFVSAKQASSIYKLYGTSGLPSEHHPKPDAPVAGRIGYHYRSGKHGITEYDWIQYLKFADKHFKPVQK